jgi:hypothetical protein
MDYDDIYAQMLELDFNSDSVSDSVSEFNWEEFDLSTLSL